MFFCGSLFLSFNFIDFNFGDYSLGVTPLPIPNREVKPQRADGTACAGVWKSRSLPNLFYPGKSFTGVFCFKCIIIAVVLN